LCPETGLSRSGFVFKAHRLLFNPTLGLRVIKKKKTKKRAYPRQTMGQSVPEKRVILLPVHPGPTSET